MKIESKVKVLTLQELSYSCSLSLSLSLALSLCFCCTLRRWRLSLHLMRSSLVTNVAGHALLLSCLSVTHRVCHWSKVLQSVFFVLTIGKLCVCVCVCVCVCERERERDVHHTTTKLLTIHYLRLVPGLLGQPLVLRGVRHRCEPGGRVVPVEQLKYE